MSKSRSLIFFGNERLGTGISTSAPTLQSLIKTGYDVQGLVVSNKSPNSRSKRPLEVQEVAKKYKIPVITDLKLNNFSAQFGVLVAYGRIIPQSIIDKFPDGIINIHPSLLPKFRGPTPVESAILSGVPETGVSLMKLVAKMDAGPVFSQQKVTLNGHETKADLAKKLNQIGAELLTKHLPDILSGSLEAKPQNEGQAIYTALIDKSLSKIDLSLPAEILERQVRAYAGWPRSTTKIHDQEVIVTKSRVVQSENDGKLVLEANPGYLEIEELIAPSGRKMSGADFLRGYSKQR